MSSVIEHQASLTLDVVIPTYNRRQMLERTLASLRAAERPDGMIIRIIAVDNNSGDDTAEFLLHEAARSNGGLSYVFEKRQGRSHALNAGIAAGTGTLIGMIDDDEEVHEGWYRRIYRAFTESENDFIGGPYIPRWNASPPAWLPSDYPGVIGWIDGGDQTIAYGDSYSGILMGGNAVIKRSVLNRAGPYNTSLSRCGSRLLAGEDEDMYRRLLAIGARGFYIPDLIIYHHVPPERLTKRYFRSWCFWRGVSRGVLDRQCDEAVAYFAGVPRWLYGKAARGLTARIRYALRRAGREAEKFSSELALWDLAGFFYGKHFYRPTS